MDLASAPTLHKTAMPTRFDEERHGSVRFLSPDYANHPDVLAAWEELAIRACEPNPFFEAWFACPSLKAFAGNNRITLFAHFTNGELTGLFPLAHTLNYYGHPVPHSSVWLHDNAFCGSPLVAVGAEQSFWRDLLAALDQTPGLAVLFHLPRLPEKGILNRALDAVLEEQGRKSYTVRTERRAMLTSELLSDDYLARSMSAKKRKELRRQHKRLSEEGNLTFERLYDCRGLDSWTKEYLALEAAGWKGDARSALANHENTRRFFTETLKCSAAAGRLERLALRLDGRPIAMLANFITAPGAYSFKTTFDEAYARFSPGMLLQLENLCLLDRTDIAWADSCAAEGHPMIERLWREKRTLVSRNIAIGGPVRRAIFNRLMAHETRRRTA